MDEKLNELKKTAEETLEKLGDDVLNAVTGAGNPFEEEPRVPTQPIDDELRDKG